jgi:hypothetical protein
MASYEMNEVMYVPELWYCPSSRSASSQAPLDAMYCCVLAADIAHGILRKLLFISPQKY